MSITDLTVTDVGVDLIWGCLTGTGEYDPGCLSPQLYGAKAEQVQRESRDRGVDLGRRVIITTDERDPVYR